MRRRLLGWSRRRRSITERRGLADLPVHFIVSAPRSGSTWLMRALDAHPQVLATENRIFGQFCEIWPNDDGSATPRITLDKYVRALSEHVNLEGLGLSRDSFENRLLGSLLERMLSFQLEESGKQCVVDKVTPYSGTASLVLESIGQYLPKAKVWQLVRDGRDVLTSSVFFWLQRGDKGAERYRYFIEGETERPLRRFFTDEDFDRWCPYWSGPIEAFSDCLPDAPLVRYETMLENQEGQLERICREIGVDCSASVLRECAGSASFSRMSGGRRRGEEAVTAPARKGIAGDWRRYFTRRDGELFDARAGGLLVRFGYEADRRWYENLPSELAPGARED